MLTLLAFGLALGIGGFLWRSAETSSVIALQDKVAALKPVMTGFRLFAIGFVALLWPVLILMLCRWGRIDAARTAQLLSLRWRVVTWLVVLELVLGQNLPSRFLTALLGLGT